MLKKSLTPLSLVLLCVLLVVGYWFFFGRSSTQETTTPQVDPVEAVENPTPATPTEPVVIPQVALTPRRPPQNLEKQPLPAPAPFLETVHIEDCPSADDQLACYHKVQVEARERTEQSEQHLQDTIDWLHTQLQNHTH